MPNGDDESLFTAFDHFWVCICFASGTTVLIIIADPRPQSQVVHAANPTAPLVLNFLSF